MIGLLAPPLNKIRDSDFEPSHPRTESITSDWPFISLWLKTTAPEPSPKRIQVDLSSQLLNEEYSKDFIKKGVS